MRKLSYRRWNYPEKKAKFFNCTVYVLTYISYYTDNPLNIRRIIKFYQTQLTSIENKCSNKYAQFITYAQIKAIQSFQIDNKKGLVINLVFLSSEMYTEQRDIFIRILGTTRTFFGWIIFINWIEREDIPHMVSSKKRK